MFKEHGKPPRRKKGTDRWNYKATPIDTWDGDHGIRKRFGCVRVGKETKEKLLTNVYKLVQKVQTGSGFEIIEGTAALHHINTPREQILRGAGGVKSEPDEDSDIRLGSGGVSEPQSQSESQSHRALLEMKLTTDMTKYIAFQDSQGKERGGISLGPHGVYLSSTTGDFCEWHPRAASEEPMEEGDLVRGWPRHFEPHLVLQRPQ